MRLLQHPPERDLGQRFVGIAAADVRMDARKPDLQDLFRDRRAWLRRLPPGRLERTAPFIDRQRLARHIDVAAQPGVVELKVHMGQIRGDSLHPVQRHPESAHRVEHAKEAQANLPAAPVGGTLVKARIDPLLLAEPVRLVGVFDRALVRSLQDTRVVNESGERTCGVGAAGKTEDENLRAIRVVTGEPPIGVPHVLRKTLAQGASGQAHPGLQAHTLVVEDVLGVGSAVLAALLMRSMWVPSSGSFQVPSQQTMSCMVLPRLRP